MALSGLGSKLMGFIATVEEEPTAATPQQAQPTAPQSMVFSAAGASAPTPAPGVSLPPALDPTIVQHLQQKVMSRRTAFTSLLEAAEKLKDFIPDDLKRLQAAAKTNGGDKAAVLNAIEVHIKDLDMEAANFKRFADSEAQTKVAALTASADQADQAATGAEQRIQALQAEIAQLHTTIGDKRAAAAQARSEASAAQSDLDAKSQAFVGALTAVKGSLVQQKSVLATQL